MNHARPRPRARLIRTGNRPAPVPRPRQAPGRGFDQAPAASSHPPEQPKNQKPPLSYKGRKEYTQRPNHGEWVNPSSKMGQKGSTNVYPHKSRWSENGLFMRKTGIVVRGLQMYTNVYPSSKTRKIGQFSRWSERGKPFKKAENGVNPYANHDGRF